MAKYQIQCRRENISIPSTIFSKTPSFKVNNDFIKKITPFLYNKSFVLFQNNSMYKEAQAVHFTLIKYFIQKLKNQSSLGEGCAI